MTAAMTATTSPRSMRPARDTSPSDGSSSCWDRRCGRARAGTVAGTVARNERANPRGESGQVPRASRPSSPNGSIDVVHDDVHDRHHEHDVTPRVRTFLRRFRVSDVAIASFARWARSLHLLASVVSLDGAGPPQPPPGTPPRSPPPPSPPPRRPCPRITSCPRASRASNRSDRISSRRAPPRTDQRAPRRRRERARSPPSPPPRSRRRTPRTSPRGRYSSRLRSRGSSNYERNVVCDAKGKGDGRRVRLARDRG